MGVIFNKKRTVHQFLGLIKRKIILGLKYIPYRITAPWRKLPDFIIIGAMKAGTTSLFEYLDQHPDVSMSREKEVQYFAKHYYRSTYFYKSFFDYKSRNKMAGEASPYYFFDPRVPARIKKDLPETKIILLLRDPVLRALSHYNHVKGVDPANDFHHAVELEPMRVLSKEEKIANRPYFTSLSHHAYSYISMGMYFKHLSNWLKIYDREELLIMKSEDMYENPERELKKVYQFLELKEDFPHDLSPKNQRNYAGLNSSDYLKYKMLFKEDGRKLKELLGERFSW